MGHHPGPAHPAEPQVGGQALLVPTEVPGPVVPPQPQTMSGCVLWQAQGKPDLAEIHLGSGTHSQPWARGQKHRLAGHGAWSPGITQALRREGFTSCWMGHHLQASFELPSPVNKAKAPSLQNTAVGSLAEESLLLEVFTAIEFFPSLRGVQHMDTKSRKCKQQWSSDWS